MTEGKDLNYRWLTVADAAHPARHARALSVTELLGRWQGGDHQALDALLPLVYDDLRNIARYHLRRERPDHTLQSGALVNEAYVRLAEHQPMKTEDRAHFLAPRHG